MSKYKQQATQQYDQSYNAKVEAMKNQLAQNQLALEQSKGGINQNFDHQVGQQNLGNKIGKNNMSNSMLGRGMGASSIVTSGLAEADQINNRKVGDINMNRTNALNDVEAQKTQLAQNTNNVLAQMSADRLDGIEALARQLEDRQWDKDFKNKQYALQAQAQANEQAYRNAQLSFQKQQYADRNADRNRIDPNKINGLKADYNGILSDPNIDEATRARMLKDFSIRYAGIPGMEDVISHAGSYQSAPNGIGGLGNAFGNAFNNMYNNAKKGGR